MRIDSLLPPPRPRASLPARFAAATLSFATVCAALCLTGCGAGARTLPNGAVQGQPFSGNVRGGDQPVSFSTIQFFAAGSGGYGSAATSLLTVPVMTDANGNFSITGDYTCPSASALVYLVVTGGNPGLAPGTNNAALAEMGVLGACGTLSASTFVSVNELTTVAAAYTLQPFMQDYAHIAAPVSNLQGLAAAFAESFDLVTITGHPGGLPATAATLPLATLDTLADIVSACVNSTGSLAASAPCGRLSAAATPTGGTAPTDTLQAMLLIARNPANNVAALFNTIAPSAPYLPTLSKAPADFTLAVQFYAPAFRTPQDLAIDASGTVWVLGSPGTATNGSSTVSTLTATGLGASYTQQNHNFGNLAIDTANDIWLTDSANSQVIELTNNGTRASSLAFSGGGITGPGPIAFDPAGNAWVSNNSATVSELNASGTPLSPAKGFSTGSSNGPVALAIDAQGNVWTTDSAGNAVSKLSNAGAPGQRFARQRQRPQQPLRSRVRRRRQRVCSQPYRQQPRPAWRRKSTGKHRVHGPRPLRPGRARGRRPIRRLGRQCQLEHAFGARGHKRHRLLARHRLRRGLPHQPLQARHRQRRQRLGRKPRHLGRGLRPGHPDPRRSLPRTHAPRRGGPAKHPRPAPVGLFTFGRLQLIVILSVAQRSRRTCALYGHYSRRQTAPAC